MDHENDDDHRNYEALFKFRSVVRTVISNTKWLNDIDNIDARTSFDENEKFKETFENKFNINEKCLLFKPVETRTEEEIEQLLDKINRMDIFKEFNYRTKRFLAVRSNFLFYEKERVLLRVGHRPMAMYLILSGEISVIRKVYDDSARVWHSERLATLVVGDVLGEASLVHSQPRSATCVTRRPCEVLRVMREDHELERPVFRRDTWEEVQHAMSRFTYFSTLSEAEIKETSVLSKIINFHKDETIFGDGIGIPSFAYFVLSGQCRMIETLNITSRKCLGKTYFKLHKMKTQLPKIVTKDFGLHQIENSKGNKKHGENSFACKLSDHVVRSGKVRPKTAFRIIKTDQNKRDGKGDDSGQPDVHFVQVCLMNEGACFNLGESLLNRRVVAANEVKCMLIPRHWLWNKNTSYIWEKVKHYLDTVIPSTESVFREFVTRFYWNEYKKKVLGEIIGANNIITNTTVHDVPYSVRIHDEFS